MSYTSPDMHAASLKPVQTQQTGRPSRLTSFLPLTLFLSAAFLSLSGAPSAHAQAAQQVKTQTPQATAPVANASSDLQAIADRLNVSVATAQQIQSIEDDKASWTPAQQKITSDFIYAARMAQGQDAVPGVQTLETGVTPDSAGRVRAIIQGSITPALLDAVTAAGGTIVNDAGGDSLVADVPLLKIEELAARSDVTTIRRFIPPIHNTQMPAQLAARLQSHPMVPRIAPTAAQRQARIRAAIQAAMPPSFANSAPGDMVSFGLNGINTGVVGEGVTEHDVTTAFNTYGVTGKNIRIGVLSDGDKFLAQSQATFDLPATDSTGNAAGSSVTVAIDDTQTTRQLQDGPATNPTNNAGEGTAMMQIVHDMAPDAKIYFATADTSEAQFAKNILLLRYKYHCDIIIDDVFYFDEPPFSDGQVAQAVNNVVADGALYFSSAGNSGHITTSSINGTSTASCWEGDFVDGGTVTLPTPASTGATSETGNVHLFAPGVPYDTANYPNITNTTNNTGTAVLSWSDPASGSSNDYDLICLTNTGSAYAASVSAQTGSQLPFERVNVKAGYRLYVLKYAGVARALHLDTFGSSNAFAPSMTYTTGGQTFGHAAAVNAFGVAATPATNNNGLGGTYPTPFSSSNVSEYFSSGGPRPMFFNVTGGPSLTITGTTPGYTLPVSTPTYSLINGYLFANGGYTTRQKPDITAADGVTSSAAFTSSSGLNPFYGTSAAAPHAGAIAALVKSYQTSNGGLTVNGSLLTVAEMRTVLTSTAIDIEAPGYDVTTGYGIVMPAPALKFLTNFLNPASITTQATTTTTATITWTTDLPSSSVVNYGTTGYTSMATGAANATSHSVTITGLTPGTLYHYQVTSATPTSSLVYTDNASGTDRTFVTAPVASVGTPSISVSGISATATGGTSVQVTLTNSGTGTATNARLTLATLGSVNTSQSLPISLGNIAPNGSTTVTLTFPAQTSGSRVVFRLAGTDDSGTTFSSSMRVAIP